MNFSLLAQIQDHWVEKLTGVLSESIALNPLDNNVIYTTVSNTFVVSQDGGNTWQSRGAVPAGLRKSIVVSSADTSIIIMHSDDLLRSSDGGYTWDTVLANISMNGETLSFDPHNPQTVYVADFFSGNFYVSEDEGQTWSLRSNLGTTIACSIALHPSIPGLIIAGAGEGRIARSTDSGFSWSLSRQQDTYTFETPKVEWDPSNPSQAYASTYGGYFSCFRSKDFGVTWEDVGPTNLSMWGMQPNPINGNVYIGTLNPFSDSEGLWVSYDGGSSFQRSGQMTLPPVIYVKMIKVAQNGAVYILNETSVYRVDPAPSGRLIGKLNDATGNIAIPVGKITIVESSDETFVNNPEGEYETRLPTGNYTVKFEAEDTSIVVPQVAIVNGQTTELDVALPITRTFGTISGSVTNPVPFQLEGEVVLYYQNELGLETQDVLNLNSSGIFSFDDLSSLGRYDSLQVRPTTLPLVNKTITGISLDENYSIDLDVADVLVSRRSGNVFQTFLKRNHISFSVDERSDVDRTYSPDVVSYTNYKTLIWSGQNDTAPFTSSGLDSLQKGVELGQNILFAGQYILERNGNEPFFSSTLMTTFQGNYTGLAAGVRGFPDNALTSDLAFSINPQVQSSRDRIFSTNPTSQKMFYYGQSLADTVRVGGLNIQNTGFGGKAVLLGFDLENVSSQVVDSLLTRTMSYFGTPVGISSENENLLNPNTFLLYQNYPNPFNPSTSIDFELKKSAKVKLEIYDLLGQMVKTLLSRRLPPGKYTETWNGENGFGKLVSSGIYFYRLNIVSEKKSMKIERKMQLVR